MALLQLLLVLVGVCSVSLATNNSDLITSLPGITQIPFTQYAGYINVHEETGRNLFYWFTESQSNPDTDPLVLYLNGGPGCASTLSLFIEMGPFFPNPDLSLSINPYAWNRVANIIWLDSPSFTGFSYSTNQSDLTTGDHRTAKDTYKFLELFLVKYPQYANRDFWVIGQSYSGHYVPILVDRIVEENKKASTKQKINLKGFMIGNPWTDAVYDGLGSIEYLATHAIISKSTYLNIEKYCDFSKTDDEYTKKCNKYQDKANQEKGTINEYNIYDNAFPGDRKRSVESSRSGQVHSKSGQVGAHLRRQLSNNPHYMLNKLTAAESHNTWTEGNLIDVYRYLASPALRKAAHVSDLVSWDFCNENTLNYSNADQVVSMLPIYQSLIAKTDLRMLIYSGDIDPEVAITGTLNWLESLNMNEALHWSPWFDPADNSTGGYVTVYPRLTFTTVRGASHLVSASQPSRAYHMFESFLQNKPF